MPNLEPKAQGGASLLSEKIRRGIPNRLKRWTRSPFHSCDRRGLGRSSIRGPIVHCTYHKMGTKWFTSVLAAVADHYGLSFQWIDNQIDELDTENDIIVLDHSDLIAQQISPCVGSHLIRDFRDVVVSGYYYHLWTEESWARTPSSRYKGLGYRQYLNGLSEDEGLLAEILRFADYAEERGMKDWNFRHPSFLELKYEQVFGNEKPVFRTLFEHYGFTPDAIDVGLGIADRFSFRNQTKNRQSPEKSHLRSGRSGQWREVFKKEHEECFKEQLGELLILAGYESSNDWR